MRSRPPRGLGAACGDDPPASEHRDAVGQVLGFVHVVGGQEDCLAELAQAGDDVPRGTACCRVEPGRRFVEEHDLRVADQGERDVEAPALPAREVAQPRYAPPSGNSGKGKLLSTQPSNTTSWTRSST